jgi:hypothetical protein
MAKDDKERAAGAPPVYLDMCRRYIGARLRAAYADLETQPLPNEHVELVLRLRQRERERERKRA